MIPVTDLDIVFISYDEPQADELFSHLCSISPRPPLRVHGVKGFDAAHKAAARKATTDRFITVDGDNRVRKSFFKTYIDPNNPADIVYSYNAYNTVNGLTYGNGSIKIWPRDLVLKIDTHERTGGNDFCWTFRYWQVDHIGSDVLCAQTPLHAFRAGYREAVKLSLVSDVKLPIWAETVERIYPPNLSRLNVWASIGRDVENGEWCIYGAICGLYDLWWLQINSQFRIAEYDWFVLTFNVASNTHSLIHDLTSMTEALQHIGLDIPYIDAEISRWFKRVYLNAPRPDGLMIPNMQPPSF